MERWREDECRVGARTTSEPLTTHRRTSLSLTCRKTDLDDGLDESTHTARRSKLTVKPPFVIGSHFMECKRFSGGRRFYPTFFSLSSLFSKFPGGPIHKSWFYSWYEILTSHWKVYNTFIANCIHVAGPAQLARSDKYMPLHHRYFVFN